MAVSQHVTTRVYGQVFGTPPFENASGAAAFTNVKPYPVAPLTSLPTGGVTFWPLQNGVQVGNFYVYSVIELPPTGLNQPSVKLVTDTSVTNLVSSGS